MDSTRGRTLLSPKWLLAPVLVVAVIALLLAWPKSEQESAEAASGGPEMAVDVTSGAVACPGGKDPSHICVPGGDPFDLTVEVVQAPAGGYILAQTFIVYGVNLTYKKVTTGTPSEQCAAEFVWPDLDPSTCLRGQQAGIVAHGGLSGLLPPQPKSNHTGDILVLEFNCTTESTTNEILLLPYLDQVAGTDGALFVELDGVTQVIPKVGSVTVNCLGPTPTPTETEPPESPTPTVSPTPTDTPTPTPPPSERPDVSVNKIDLADPVDSDADFTYRVTVSSIGLETAEGVKVVDTLPAGTTFVSATGAGANCSHDSGVVTCQIKDDMDPGEDIVIDIVVTAPSPSSDDRITNNVEITSTNEPFANTGNNKDIEETVVLAPRSDVTIQKISDPTFVEGDEDVTYRLTATNLGPNKATDVTVSDVLPDSADATFVSSTDPECGDPSGGKVTCDLGSLQPGEDVVLEIVMTALPVTRDTTLKNVATISSTNELFGQTGNNTAIANTPVVAPPPDLVVTKDDSDDPILRLQEFSYSIFVENIGDGDALDVVISDVLPKVSIVRAQTFIHSVEVLNVTGATCELLEDNKFECELGDVNAGQNVKITLDVRAPTILDDDVLTNVVSGSVLNPDENPAGNQDTELTVIRACFDVSGDLYVSLFQDILQIVNRYQAQEGDAEYDIIYDFDGNGSISLPNDILPVLQHYQQDCTLLL